MEGRAELVEQLMIKAGERVVELGAGTGRNPEYYRPQIPNLAGVELVDLCPALLAQARRRVIQWANVAVIEADATHYRPFGEVDHVYFSYALTMIPDWSTAIEGVTYLNCGDWVDSALRENTDGQLELIHWGR